MTISAWELKKNFSPDNFLKKCLVLKKFLDGKFLTLGNFSRKILSPRKLSMQNFNSKKLLKQNSLSSEIFKDNF